MHLLQTLRIMQLNINIIHSDRLKFLYELQMNELERTGRSKKKIDTDRIIEKSYINSRINIWKIFIK